MSLLICVDCQGRVSSSAMTCVHCGNVLQVEKPGFLGSVIRVLYAVFTIVLIAFTLIVMKAGGDLGGSIVLVPLASFGIWFVVSIGLAVLLYVTRHGRIVRVGGTAAMLNTGDQSGWSNQTRVEPT